MTSTRKTKNIAKESMKNNMKTISTPWTDGDTNVDDVAILVGIYNDIFYNSAHI